MSVMPPSQVHWMHARLHILARVLVLCFVLCTVAMAGHAHQIGQIENHATCDLCTAFGGLIDAPPLAARFIARSLTDVPVPAPALRIIATRAASTAQARAPPSC